MEMSEKEIRKYLVFSKKSKISKNEALHRLVRVHKLTPDKHAVATAVAEKVYG